MLTWFTQVDADILFIDIFHLSRYLFDISITDNGNSLT